MKAFQALLLGVCLAMAPLTMAAAAAPGTAALSQAPTSVRVWGSVTRVDEKNARIEVADGAKKDQSIILHINDDTSIVNNQSKKALSIKDIKKGDTVYVWHDPIMTMSLPPQSSAQVIVTGIAADAMAGQLFEVIESSQNKNGDWLLFNQERDLYLTVPAKLKNIPVFNSKDTLQAKDIAPGTRLLVWYNMVAESYPAQTTATALLALPDAYDGYISIRDEKITVNGKAMGRDAYVDAKGNTFVPLSDIAKVWGFSVTWNSRTNTMTLRKGESKIAFVRGKDEFTANGSKIATLAPFAKNKTLYVAADSLRHLGDYKIVLPVE